MPKNQPCENIMFLGSGISAVTLAVWGVASWSGEPEFEVPPPPGIGDRLGLPNDWAYNVIKQVGNSAEIFDNNIGENSPYKLERGLNGLWSDGGVIVPMILD